MAPNTTGQVIERDRAGGRTFALRFRAYGQRHYITLGGVADGWSRKRAEAELRHVLADVERGIWTPPVKDAADCEVPTFHEFASQWMEAKSREVRENTVSDYSWQLCNHLLPFFCDHHLNQITVAEIDRYREHKVAEGKLSNESINKTITRMGQILAVAEERDLITRNPVRVNTRNRKLKAERKRPVWLDRAEQITTLIEAAGQLDDDPASKTLGRRALIATLVFAGPRLGEATALLWQDIDLATGRIWVGRSKTAAGVREVDVVPVLRDELIDHRHRNAEAKPDDFVFPTSNGTRRDKDNARERVVKPVIEHARELLANRDDLQLPEPSRFYGDFSIWNPRS